MSAGLFSGREPTRDIAVACARSAISRERREVLHEIASRRGIEPNAILVRWLASAASHVYPVIGSANPDHVRSIMAAASSAGLDDAVAELVRSAGHASPGGNLTSLLLPADEPRW